MTKDELEKFFQRYERFFMQSLSGEIDGDKMSALYAPEFIAASPLGVLAGKMMLAFVKPYLMAMSSTARWERRRCEFEV